MKLKSGVLTLLGILLAAAMFHGQTPDQRRPLHHHHRQREVSIRHGRTGGASEVGRHSRYQHARLLRQRDQEAGGHAQHGQRRQSAGRAIFRRGRGAGRHARRQDSRSRSRWRHGRGRICSRVWRAQRDQLHAHAASAVARAHLVLSHRSRREHRPVQGARFRFLGQDSAASFLRLHRGRARRTARRAVRWCPRSSAATWIRPKPASATRSIFR